MLDFFLFWLRFVTLHPQLAENFQFGHFMPEKKHVNVMLLAYSHRIEKNNNEANYQKLHMCYHHHLMLPDFDCPVLTSRCDGAAIWAPVQCIDLVVMARQGLFRPSAGWDLPQLGGAIL